MQAASKSNRSRNKWLIGAAIVSAALIMISGLIWLYISRTVTEADITESEKGSELNEQVQTEGDKQDPARDPDEDKIDQEHSDEPLGPNSEAVEGRNIAPEDETQSQIDASQKVKEHVKDDGTIETEVIFGS